MEEKGKREVVVTGEGDDDIPLQGGSTARTAMVATWLPPAASVARRSRG